MRTAQATTKHRIQISDDARFLTAGEVMQRYSVSRMWLVRKMASGDFPKAIRLGHGRLRFWKLADLEQWEAKQS